MRSIEKLLLLAVAGTLIGCGESYAPGNQDYGEGEGDGLNSVSAGDWDEEGPPGREEGPVRPAIGTIDTLFRLTVAVDPREGKEPSAVIQTAGGSYAFVIDENASDRYLGYFELTYTATGEEPEGRHPVTVALGKDDEAKYLVTVYITFDFTPPLVTVKWQKPAWQTATRSDAALDFVAVAEVGTRVETVAVIDELGDFLASIDDYDVAAGTTNGTAQLISEQLAGVSSVAVEVIVTDEAGNASDPIASRAAQLPLDDEPPTGTGLVIESLDPTPSQVIAIRPTATDDSDLWVRISGDVIALPGLPAHVWVPLELRHDVMLTGGSGDKVVEASFRDGADNHAGPESASVELDQGADASPPDVLLPEDGAVLTSSTVLLQWTPRLGASAYTVEVWVDQPAEAPIAGSPFTTPHSELTIAVAEDVTYHWQVRADVTTSGEYSSIAGHPAAFDRLGDAIYLYCPAGDACADSDAVGNRAKPLRTTAGALTAARAHGIDTIRIAARGSDEPYAGSIDLVEGVNLEGGYANDFETRDPTSEVTTILGTGAIVLRAVGITAPTAVSGLFLRGSPSLADAVGVEVLAAGDGLLIEDCIIEGGDAGARSYGVRIAASEGPRLRHNRISAGDAPQLSVGLYTHDSAVDLRANRIMAGASNEHSAGAVIAGGGSVTLTSNVLTCNTAPFAVALELDAPATVSNNTLIGTSHGLYLGPGSASPLMTNNLLLLNGTGARFFIAEHSDDPPPARSLEHNAFVDLDGGAGLVLYVDQSGRCPSGADTTACTLAEMETLSDWTGGPDKARGNVELGAGLTLDASAEPCVLAQGALTDQQWWDLIYGGKDTGGDNCGAPVGGPGSGQGAESCGEVVTGVDDETRTATLEANELPSQAGAAGYSIGACEIDPP